MLSKNNLLLLGFLALLTVVYIILTIQDDKHHGHPSPTPDSPQFVCPEPNVPPVNMTKPLNSIKDHELTSLISNNCPNRVNVLVLSEKGDRTAMIIINAVLQLAELEMTQLITGQNLQSNILEIRNEIQQMAQFPQQPNCLIIISYVVNNVHYLLRYGELDNQTAFVDKPYTNKQDLKQDVKKLIQQQRQKANDNFVYVYTNRALPVSN